jgi:hypothetical protein
MCLAIPSTTAVVTAAKDEVSVAIAALFSNHAKEFQELSAQTAEFNNQFAQTWSGGGAADPEIAVRLLITTPASSVAARRPRWRRYRMTF